MLLGTDIHATIKQRHYKAEVAAIMGAVIKAAVLTDTTYNKDTDHAVYSPAVAQMPWALSHTLAALYAVHPTAEYR